jgi:hypothetical protein
LPLQCNTFFYFTIVLMIFFLIAVVVNPTVPSWMKRPLSFFKKKNPLSHCLLFCSFYTPSMVWGGWYVYLTQAAFFPPILFLGQVFISRWPCTDYIYEGIYSLRLVKTPFLCWGDEIWVAG